MRTNISKKIISAFALASIMLVGCGVVENSVSQISNQSVAYKKSFSINDLPEYSGATVVEMNGNRPYFYGDELTTKSFEKYSELDKLGRCGVAVASVGVDIMPTEERGSIGQVKPTGWQTVRYDDIISTKYLYNRSHLLGFQLTGENANVENLITGTRQMNEAMIPFENMIADYVEDNNKNVYYRVTPVFEGNNLLATGVLIEAQSIEDDGLGVMFNMFCYNVQDGIAIDYLTGDNWLDDGSQNVSQNVGQDSTNNSTNNDTNNNTSNNTSNDKIINFVLNTNSNKIHIEDCHYVEKMSDETRKDIKLMLKELEDNEYDPCKVCIAS